MSIEKKKGTFYYTIMIHGKRYRGTCKNCRTKREAIAYENERRKELQEEAMQADIVRYHEGKIIEARGGNHILLTESIEILLNKPKFHATSDKVKNQYRAWWSDFVAFAEQYGISTIQEVKKNMIEDYINYIRQNGRFVKEIVYRRDGKEIRTHHIANKLAAATLNKIQATLKMIFDSLMSEAGITTNPVDVPMLRPQKVKREIFTEKEIQKIINGSDEMISAIMRTALYTGLREGDICTMKWSDIDFNSGFIVKTMNKTQKQVVIPILDFDFLLALKEKSNCEYVFPEAHKMYVENPYGLSYRIKCYLQSMNISTQIETAQGRKQSVKDFHSCRHTFATICASRGIPLPTVQTALGHSSSEITEIYTAHLKKDTLKKDFGKFALQETSTMRHGIENTFLLGAVLNKAQILDPGKQYKLGKLIGEKLNEEEMAYVLNLFGVKYKKETRNMAKRLKNAP